MKRVAFSEKQPEYRYFPLADGMADVFVYSFVGEDTEKVGMGEGETETETTVFLYDVNEFRVSQDLVTEDMVKSEPLKYLSYKIPIEEKTEDLMLEVLADHEERICLMELGIEEVAV